jgi:phosphonopyruvate decarboxylase
MQLEQAAFPAEVSALRPALSLAAERMEATGLPYAFVVRKGDVADTELDVAPRAVPEAGRRMDFADGGARPTRVAALERLLAIVPDEAAVIATTGKCGRELFTLADREQHLYQVGSMGAASGMALGVALNVERPVVVLDGDGAALMKMGTFATIGAYAPRNLVHVALDNGVHDSTGGQPTVSPSVDFAMVALACGYQLGVSCASLEGFEAAFRAALGQGPALIHLRIAPGSMAKLGRPTVKPAEVARRFRAFLGATVRAEPLPA